MPLNNIIPEKGKLLLSEPSLNESYFKRSVILLAEHNEEGSLGFILNKPVDVRINEVLTDFDEFDFPLFLGGPVKKDNLFFVHTLGKKVEGSILINDNLYWGGNFEMVRDSVKNGEANEANIRFFIGYAGWESQQLKEELNDNSWVVSQKADNSILLKDTKELWKSTLRKMGNEIAYLSFFPENPQLN